MKLVIFDCDGTLVDSQHLIVEAMQTAFSINSLPVPVRQLILRQVGLSVAEAMKAITGFADGDAIAALCRDYRAAFGALRETPGAQEPLFPGAQMAIKQLSGQQDILLGIATGKSRRGVDRLLEREGFAGLFATIQTADDAPSKPHPAMVHQAMDEVGAEIGDTVMIGDTSFDMLMARAAGVAALGVGWGYHDASELLEAGAAKIVGDFPELVEHLIPGRITVGV